MKTLTSTTDNMSADIICMLISKYLQILLVFCLETSEVLRESFQVATGYLSSDQESPKANKSALKSPLSSSLSSITKKRVLFVDQENELADNMTKQLPWYVSKIVATTRLMAVEMLSFPKIPLQADFTVQTFTKITFQ
jgi:hypothetical protein